MAELEAILATPARAANARSKADRPRHGDISGCMFGLTNKQLLQVAACRPRPTQLEAHLADRLTEALREIDLLVGEQRAVLGAH